MVRPGTVAAVATRLQVLQGHDLFKVIVAVLPQYFQSFNPEQLCILSFPESVIPPDAQRVQAAEAETRSSRAFKYAIIPEGTPCNWTQRVHLSTQTLVALEALPPTQSAVGSARCQRPLARQSWAINKASVSQGGGRVFSWSVVWTLREAEVKQVVG